MRPPRTLATPRSRHGRAPWGWAAAGVLLGGLLGTVAFAPARWLAASVAQGSDARVQLLASQGTVWNGSAELALGAGPGSQDATALPGRLAWRIRPTLSGLQLALQAPCCLPGPWVWTARASLAGLQLQLSDLSDAQPAHWPSALLAGLGTPWNTLQLQGTLALSSQQLALHWQRAGWSVSGQARLDATRMSTSLSTLRPVGSYRLTLVGGPSPVLDLRTLDGSLQLSGSGRWNGGQLQFSGEARAAPERADALANLLNIIGRRDGARSIIKVG